MNQNISFKRIVFISLLIISISLFVNYIFNNNTNENNANELITWDLNTNTSNDASSDLHSNYGQFSENDDSSVSSSDDDDDLMSSSDEIFEKDMFYDQGNIILIMDSKTSIPIEQYPNEEYEPDGRVWRGLEYIDLDKDGTPELIATYYSGGAHCCFQYDIFSKMSANEYVRVYTYTGGENAVQIKNGIIKVSFYEQLGYFHSCYACYIDEELLSKQFSASYNLKYKNKSFHIDGPNESILKVITKDLEFLKNRKIPPLKGDYDFDDGTRKAYALRIITYYYNNNLDLKATRELFYKTYLGSDRESIWQEIEAFINKSSNDNMNHSLKEVLKKIKKQAVVKE